MRVLFLGASRAVTLLEHFRHAAERLDVPLELLSVDEPGPWHPVALAGLARIVPAPVGEAVPIPELVREHRADIVVPATDEAAVALAEVAEDVIAAGALPVCSSAEVCRTMTDKRQANLLLRSLDVRVPSGLRFPLLAKPRRGSGSQGIVRFDGAAELTAWSRRNRATDYLLQPFVVGTELSVDGYVDRAGRVLALVPRRRLVVRGGEVTLTCTLRCDEAAVPARAVLGWGRWYGPVTIQVIHDGRQVWVIEANPRCGSGITCSITAGLAVPDWILRERMGLPLPEGPVAWREGVCVSRSLRDHPFTV